MGHGPGSEEVEFQTGTASEYIVLHTHAHNMCTQTSVIGYSVHIERQLILCGRNVELARRESE